MKRKIQPIINKPKKTKFTLFLKSVLLDFVYTEPVVVGTIETGNPIGILLCITYA